MDEREKLDAPSGDVERVAKSIHEARSSKPASITEQIDQHTRRG